MLTVSRAFAMNCGQTPRLCVGAMSNHAARLLANRFFIPYKGHAVSIRSSE